MLKNSPSAILVAAIATIVALIWLAADVELSDAGHLAGLFYVGANTKLPSGSPFDETYRVRDVNGYDGEFYYLIAHDPLNRRGVLNYVDTPRYRWRRIGLPGLAHVLAFGSDDWVDQVYVALQLAFVFLGSYWLAGCAKQLNLDALWGLAFLLIPAVSISLDRMTVDLPLAALFLAVLRYARNPRWTVFAALAAAPLVRETGILIIVAWCALWAIRRDFRIAVIGVACAIPSLLWWLYVSAHTIPDVTAFASAPFSGLVRWTIHAVASPADAYGRGANAVLELVALAGMWLAFALVVVVVAKNVAAKPRLHGSGWELPELTAVAFAAFASLIGYQDIWASDYGIGRTLSPLLIALAFIALRDRRPLFAWPLLLTVPRIALQFAAEMKVALLAHP